jgi:hypothetical protein
MALLEVSPQTVSTSAKLRLARFAVAGTMGGVDVGEHITNAMLELAILSCLPSMTSF